MTNDAYVIAGVDEVGRGPLAGPVVAAAVRFLRSPDCSLIASIRDSKCLSTRQREIAYEAIHFSGADVSLGAASVSEIASMNILRASLLAMKRAVAGLFPLPELALVDGINSPDLPCRVRCIVGGDATILSIAAASIVAKVVRDRVMARLAKRFPGYGWERNAGYGTAEHRDAIWRLGPTPHHRVAFGTVRMVLASRNAPDILSADGSKG